MIINGSNLNALRAGFTSLYNDSYANAPIDWNKVAMEVNSTGPEQKYGWLGLLPRMREWLGDRVINNLKAHDYAVKNKDFEMTVGVSRNDIEDDNLGIYAPMFQMMGDASAKHPDELVFDLLKKGFETECYDGQNFFDADHPVVDEAGVEQSVSNTGGGSGAAWFLLDTTKPIKPLIFQKRRNYEMVSMDNPTDENVFMRKEYVYGVDARVNAGLGLWQLAYGSKQALDATNYNAARVSLQSRKGDHGKPLALKGSLLVVGPSNEAKALELIKAERNAAGATNIYQGTAEVLVVPYLD